MAEHTTHYNITKPTGSEAGDVSIINANMDIIDGQMYANEQAAETNAEAIQENAEAIQDLSTDYIVEQGTSGIWTYEKWNSGIAKCYASPRATGTLWTSWGSAYFNQLSVEGERNGVAYPFTFVGNNPYLFVRESSGNYWLMSAYGSTQKTGVIYAIAPVNSFTITNNPINICAIGRWK